MELRLQQAEAADTEFRRLHTSQPEPKGIALTNSVPTPSGENLEPARGLSRRTVSTAAAWTVPAVAVAVGAPMAAASDPNGKIVITAPTTFVQPGAPYPTITITLTDESTGATVPTSTAALIVTLPAGFTWFDGSVGSKPVPVFAGVAQLTGPLAVIAPTDGTTTGSILAEATDLNSPSGQPKAYSSATQALSTAYVPVFAGGNAATWGNSPVGVFDTLDGKIATSPNVVPGGLAGGAADVMPYIQNAILRASDNALFFYTPSNSNPPQVDRSGLRPGEKWVTGTAGNYMLTSFGRIFTVASGSPYTATDTALFPPTVVITQFASVLNFSSGASGGESRSFYALDSTGHVWSWGDNAAGALGQRNGTSTGVVSTPAPVVDATGTPISGITQIRQKSSGGLALRGDGTVLAWGSNAQGLNADGTSSQWRDYAAPVLTTGGVPLTGVRQLGLSDTTNANTDNGAAGVILNDGRLFTWGGGGNNEHSATSTADRNLAIENEQSAALAAAIPGGGGVLDVNISYSAINIIMSDNKVWSWGQNAQWQGGAGINSFVSSPQKVVRDYYGGTQILATRFFPGVTWYSAVVLVGAPLN